jgi:hypothetical protein
MSKTRSEVLAESQRKGIVAGVATAATVTAAVVNLPVIAFLGAPVSLALGYRWWKHRAENGIRF